MYHILPKNTTDLKFVLNINIKFTLFKNNSLFRLCGSLLFIRNTSTKRNFKIFKLQIEIKQYFRFFNMKDTN